MENRSFYKVEVQSPKITSTFSAFRTASMEGFDDFLFKVPLLFFEEICFDFLEAPFSGVIWKGQKRPENFAIQDWGRRDILVKVR